MSYICVKKLVLILVKWRLSEKNPTKFVFPVLPACGRVICT